LPGAKTELSNNNTFAKIQGGNFGGYILWLPHFTHTTCDLDFADLHANFKIGKGIVITQQRI
jgi:hypothetical protein